MHTKLPVEQNNKYTNLEIKVSQLHICIGKIYSSLASGMYCFYVYLIYVRDTQRFKCFSLYV